LVHAMLGTYLGMDALVRVVDWSEGSFEFITDTEPPSRTIELDLHRAVMQALKLHDEMKEAEEQQKREQSEAEGATDTELTPRLSEFVASNGFALHACVLSSEGVVRAAADGPEGTPQGIDSLRSAIHTFVQSYPRSDLNRIFVVDSGGTAVMVGLSNGNSLIVLAGKDASLGAVSVSVGRLAAVLE
jgi:hypothetical protein